MDSNMETNETSYGTSHNFENWTPHPQDVPQARMDSFDKVLEEYRTGGTDFNGRADSGIMIAEIMAALAPGRHIATESQQDEVMDSMESVPSSVINSALKGYDKTSLPEVHDNEITQALMPGQRPPYLLNQAILLSPPSYEESYAQATYHDLQTRPFLDPNQEIHGVQPGFYSNALPVPEQQSEPQRFQPATTANQPDSQNVHSDDDIVSVKSTDSSDTSYKLSPETNLEITVSYSTLPVCGTVKVERADGCIMFYNKTSKELLDRCQAVSFPSLENTEVRKKFEKVSPRAMELTERALNALQGGLQLYWKHQKGVFAIRRSRGKIYWTSTQLASPEPQELARNVETQVFDWDTFRSSLSKTYALKATKQEFQQPKLPSIIFTFAQKWCKDTAPVTSCLVWAKVIPKKADEMVVGLFPKAEPAAHSKHNSGMLRVSLE